MPKQKRKKLTYNEMANYIVQLEMKLNNAINAIGQSVTDYIDYNNDKEKFIAFLEKKYKKKFERAEEVDNKKA
tara:strand:- start:643 stop:861 length:219 start_codon:yes stop_codon:yes gene_type:complete